MQGSHISEDFANSIVVQKDDVFLDCPEGEASQVPRDANYGLMPRIPQSSRRFVLRLVFTKTADGNEVPNWTNCNKGFPMRTLVCCRSGRGGPADSEWACCSVGAGGWTHRRVISCGLGGQHRVGCRWSAGVRWLRQAHHRTVPAQGKVSACTNKYSTRLQNAMGLTDWGCAFPALDTAAPKSHCKFLKGPRLSSNESHN